MIYLDSAATMFPKAPGVKEAVLWAAENTGNPGRSGHSLALLADRVMADCRAKLAALVGADDPTRITFASNATEALNTAILGYVPEHSHVVTTMFEHNSVLRPLYRLARERGVGLSIVPPRKDGTIAPEDVAREVSAATSLVAVNAVSNVTGAVQDVAGIAKAAHSRGARFLVDVSQMIGHMPVDVAELGADMIAFPGHKGLCGPSGTGALWTAKNLRLKPLKIGGTGIDTFARDAPDALPERLEAGTQNVHGVCGLSAALDFIMETTPGKIHAHERELADALIGELLKMPGAIVYSPREPELRGGVVAFNIGDLDSAYVGDELAARSVCVRGGFHCAPLAHAAMETEQRGAVRASFSIFNEPGDVAGLMRALYEILSGKEGG